MSDLPPELDLKFLPDWLKESPGTNRYADYQGDSDDRPRRGGYDDRRPGGGGRSGPRPPERRGPGGPGSGPRRDDQRRGPGAPGSRPPGGGNRPQGGGGPRPGGSGRPGDRRDDRRFEPRPPREAVAPAPAELIVDILPEPHAAAGIAKQIKASGRAYPVFGTSKLFLERPERHRVRIKSSNPEVLLYQAGDGPISFDRSTVDRNAFFGAKTEYYTEETVQGEPIKGNFSNVARVRGTGALLGPTNYHGYQPALRKIYEERFSRRMSFPDFQQYEIEIVNDEQAVADWKEQARSSTTFTTTKEAEPIVFKSLFEAEQHFRKEYLPQIVKSGTTLECNGQASRAGNDRYVGAAVREAWERESRFPQQMVNGLRPYFVEAGLHFFKHRKRVLFVSATKPQRHPGGQSFSDGISSILRTVEASPRIKRPDLASRILGVTPEQEDHETLVRKAQLASDLHYLIHIGHVIEFSDGALELPLSPQDKPPGQQQPHGGKGSPKQKPAAQAKPAEATAAADESVELEAPETEAHAPAGASVEGTSGEAEAPVEGTSAETEAPGETVSTPEAAEAIDEASGTVDEAVEPPAPTAEPETSTSFAEPASIESSEPAPSEIVEPAPVEVSSEPAPVRAD